MNQLIHGEITGEIIAASCEVWRVLGYGFLEKVYENALARELKRRSLQVIQQSEIDVYYKGGQVGMYLADLIVEGKVLVELKAERELHIRHEAQVLNYLKATQIKVGMLINFGERKCEWKRLVM